MATTKRAGPKRVDLPLSKLLLDNNNPRHDALSNEPEIVAQLLKHERVLELARHIAAHRATSPFDSIGVLPHPTIAGHYTVEEGNRRVCALKLLRDPKLAPSPRLKKEFQELHKQVGTLPSTVEVVLLTDRAESDFWKGIRHQGEQGGIGTRAWGAVEKARHASRSGGASNANNLAVELLDFATKSKLITKAEREEISVTTITRYVSNPVVRDALGIASNNELIIQVPTSEFERVVQHFLQDAIVRPGEVAPVHSRSNKTERDAYAAELRRKGIAPKTRLPQAATPAATAAAEKRSKNNKSADKRACIVPASFVAMIRDSLLKRLFDELRKLDPVDFSFAGGYLLRAFIERLAHKYAGDHGLGNSGDLHVVIGRCATHLEKAGASQRVLKPLLVMVSDRHSRLSPDTLGAWVHGSEIPTAAELKRRWDSLEPGIRAMLDGLK